MKTPRPTRSRSAPRTTSAPARRTRDRGEPALLAIADSLAGRVQQMRFAAPVAHVYNPLRYARAAYAEYVDRFGRGERKVLLVGMNPGPWGMTQTGVPFGEVGIVRDWLGISATVRRPDKEHPRVPVLGLDCLRSEVSGARLWGWARDTFRTPQRFFDTFFVANYCPLVFLEASGRNRTPDKLPADERRPLLDACDGALRQTVETLRPAYVIGVGAFAASRVRTALGGERKESRRAPQARRRPAAARAADAPVLGEILHPSPASPAANRGWREAAVAQMRSLGLRLPGD